MTFILRQELNSILLAASYARHVLEHFAEEISVVLLKPVCDVVDGLVEVLLSDLLPLVARFRNLHFRCC